jgi:periplasmic divalent cation tolerance protein
MHQLLLCTCPDQHTADSIARQLLTEQLAACVNILPGISSVYRWQGQIETAQEHLLLIKTHARHYAVKEGKKNK